MSPHVEGGSVLFLLSSLKMGGSERKTVGLASALAERSYRPAIAYLNGPETLLSEISPAVPATCLRRTGKFSVGALRRLIQLVGSNEVRTLVAVNLYPALYAVLAKLLLPRGRLRVYVSINTTEFVTRKEARQMALYRWVLRGADRLIFGAETQRDLWTRRYGLRAEHSHAVLYNGVDTAYFDPNRISATPAARPRSALVLVSVGKLRREKAHGDLVRAVGRLRGEGLDVSALLVGDGPERASIEGEIASLGLQDSIRITGEVGDVREFLAAADVFVLPSVAVETFSNAALEAMAMGLPVVASQVGGMHEMLAHGGGVTYPAGDVTSLCSHVRMLHQDVAARTRMGGEARRAAIERFGWQRMLDAFCEGLDGEPCGGAGTELAKKPDRADTNTRGRVAARPARADPS